MPSKINLKINENYLKEAVSAAKEVPGRLQAPNTDKEALGLANIEEEEYFLLTIEIDQTKGFIKKEKDNFIGQALMGTVRVIFSDEQGNTKKEFKYPRFNNAFNDGVNTPELSDNGKEELRSIGLDLLLDKKGQKYNRGIVKKDQVKEILNSVENLPTAIPGKPRMIRVKSIFPKGLTSGDLQRSRVFKAIVKSGLTSLDTGGRSIQLFSQSQKSGFSKDFIKGLKERDIISNLKQQEKLSSRIWIERLKNTPYEILDLYPKGGYEGVQKALNYFRGLESKEREDEEYIKNAKLAWSKAPDSFETKPNKAGYVTRYQKITGMPELTYELAHYTLYKVQKFTDPKNNKEIDDKKAKVVLIDHRKSKVEFYLGNFENLEQKINKWNSIRNHGRLKDKKDLFENEQEKALRSYVGRAFKQAFPETGTGRVSPNHVNFRDLLGALNQEEFSKSFTPAREAAGFLEAGPNPNDPNWGDYASFKGQKASGALDALPPGQPPRFLAPPGTTEAKYKFVGFVKSGEMVGLLWADQKNHFILSSEQWDFREDEPPSEIIKRLFPTGQSWEDFTDKNRGGQSPSVNVYEANGEKIGEIKPGGMTISEDSPGSVPAFLSLFEDQADEVNEAMGRSPIGDGQYPSEILDKNFDTTTEFAEPDPIMSDPDKPPSGVDVTPIKPKAIEKAKQDANNASAAAAGNKDAAKPKNVVIQAKKDTAAAAATVAAAVKMINPSDLSDDQLKEYNKLTKFIEELTRKEIEYRASNIEYDALDAFLNSLDDDQDPRDISDRNNAKRAKFEEYIQSLRKSKNKKVRDLLDEPTIGTVEYQDILRAMSIERSILRTKISKLKRIIQINSIKVSVFIAKKNLLLTSGDKSAATKRVADKEKKLKIEQAADYYFKKALEIYNQYRATWINALDGEKKKIFNDPNQNQKMRNELRNDAAGEALTQLSGTNNPLLNDPIWKKNFSAVDPRDYKQALSKRFCKGEKWDINCFINSIKYLTKVDQ